VNDLSIACPPRPQTGKDAKVGWLRPEALASVTKAENVPLPALISESDADGLDDSKRPNFAVVSCRSHHISRSNLEIHISLMTSLMTSLIASLMTSLMTSLIASLIAPLFRWLRC